jgi:hypothetical protein
MTDNNGIETIISDFQKYIEKYGSDVIVTISYVKVGKANVLLRVNWEYDYKTTCFNHVKEKYEMPLEDFTSFIAKARIAFFNNYNKRRAHWVKDNFEDICETVKDKLYEHIDKQYPEGLVDVNEEELAKAVMVAMQKLLSETANIEEGKENE